MNRSRPWGNIHSGDTVYFKDSSEPVTVRATVQKVLQFENLTPQKIKEILDTYAEADGLGVGKEEIGRYYELFKHKKYCILVFLKNPTKITPFQIDKTGFGAMAAWLTMDAIPHQKV